MDLVRRAETRYKNRMFKWLGQWIACRAVWLVLAWVVVIAAAGLWAWRTNAIAPVDMGSVLPSDHPWTLSMQRMREAFPLLNARSQAVVVGYRPSGLTAGDLAWLDRLGEQVASSLKFKTLSPAMSFLRHRLISSDHQVAMLIVNLPTTFISAASARSTEQVESIMQTMPPPAGLTAEITGTAGIGRDYSVAAQQALHRTTWVTIVAVLAILILVYRSPVGALVPLVSIGASVFVAFVVLALLAAHMGWTVSAMERIFVVVLIFGMGVDFALFWIARYREELRPTGDFDASAVTATCKTGPAIFVSAATTICGLTTLLVTQLVPTQNAGKVLAVALSITLLAALTLAPALARLLGRWLFWPTGYRGQIILGEEIIWPRVAALVTWNPRLTLIGGLLLLGAPAVWAMTLEPRYDSISELPPGSSSLRGFDIVNAHFEKGQLYSNNVMLDFSRSPRPIGELYRLSQNVSRRLAGVPGVADVYSLDAPLGRGRAQTAAQMGAMLAWLGQGLATEPSASAPARSVLSLLPGAANIREMGEYVRQFYLAAHGPNSKAAPLPLRPGGTTSPDRSLQMLRFEVLIDHLPFSPEAMKLMGQVDRVTRDAVAALAGVEWRRGARDDRDRPDTVHPGHSRRIHSRSDACQDLRIHRDCRDGAHAHT